MPIRISIVSSERPFNPCSGLGHWMKDFIQSKQSAGFKYKDEIKRLRKFDEFLVKHGLMADELSQSMFEGYEASLANVTYSSKTSYLYTIKTFAKYILKNGGRAWACDSITHPHEPVPQCIPTEHLQLFFQKLDEIKFCYPWLKYVYPVFFRILASTGMRKDEASKILRADVEWSKNRFLLREQNTKNQKSRYVYFSDFDAAMLRKYDSAIEAYFPSRTYLFIGVVSPETKPLCSQSTGKIFKKAWRNTGLSGTPTIHSLRHAYTVERIARWHQEGKNANALIPYLSKQLGHENIDCTYWYCKRLDTRFREILDLKSLADAIAVPREVIK